MSDITELLAVQRFTWATKTSPNPRLAAPISPTDTTITVTAAPTDEDGGAITGLFQMGIRNRDTGYIEFVWVAAAEASGTTITLGNVSQRGCARAGINGIDWTTGVAGNRSQHPQDSEVFCPATSLDFEQLFDCQQGVIASGANLWKVGDGTDSDIYWYAFNADGNKPYFAYKASTSKFVVAADGVTEVDMATGGILTADGGCQIVAANLSIDLAATNDLLKITGTELDTNLTATKTEIDQLSGTTNIAEADTFFGATDITGAQAETLTDESEADTLHVHNAVNNNRNLTKEVYLVTEGTGNGAGTTTIDTGSNRITMASGAVNNQFAGVTLSTYVLPATLTSVHDKNPEFYVEAAFAAATAQEGFIGFVKDGFAGTSLENAVMTIDHFGFIVEDGTLYISTADNATQTKTDISGTVANIAIPHTYRATFDGVTATFYVDGSSVGTITTNLPGNITKFQVAVIADATAADKTLAIKKNGACAFDRL